jgi:nicotinamide-nucleotide amidase
MAPRRITLAFDVSEKLFAAKMAFSKRLADLAERTLDAAKAKGWSVVTAESCTAGKLAALLSEVPGASERLHGGFVTYTKDNKTRALGVSAELLRQKSAVCGDVAVAMAEGALARSPANIAVAITGVAGPEPDEDGNPVGLVCIALAASNAQPIQIEKRYGEIGRDAIQERAMADALTELIGAIAK